MLTFKTFRDGAGGARSRKVGLDISSVETWSAFAAAAERFNDETEGGLVKAARRIAVHCSTGERVVLCALLAGANFAWLADELTGKEAWEFFGRVDTANSLAVAAVIIRRNR